MLLVDIPKLKKKLTQNQIEKNIEYYLRDVRMEHGGAEYSLSYIMLLDDYNKMQKYLDIVSGKLKASLEDGEDSD